ncbi:F0F1 ATP synthase subunit delta [Legionella sp. W05-934-2]|jgi:F-type H+-transporting ATPase subunit delta|uniref:F0F1 ATP synthase subunit delta n=1 Tax=Legionella sp. W05-934-2 TaxID=1198649 RepID=UPI0034622EE7
MSELTTIARPYAKAIFDHAQKKKKLAEWANILHVLASVAADKKAYAFLSNPTINREDKISLLLGFVPKIEDSMKDETKNFLSILAEFGRLTILPEITALYFTYRADYEKSMEVKVTSSKPLEKEQEQALVKALSKKLNREVSLSVEINESLLGGAIIQAGDFVIDGSVRGKLEKLAARLAV